MPSERFNLDIPEDAWQALCQARACMEASTDSEVVRRCILDWVPPAGAVPPAPGPRRRLHLRLEEGPARRLRWLVERTGLTLSGVAAHALLAYVPLVEAYERRRASGVRSAEPPPFV